MSKHNVAHPFAGDVFPDFDLEAEELGPSTRMLGIRTAPGGELRYQFGRHHPRAFRLPERYGGRTFGMIDQVGLVALINRQTNRLKVLAGFPTVGARVFLVGRDWGTWLDGDGAVHGVQDPAALMQQWRLPVVFQEFRQLLSFDFSINIFQRHLFHSKVRCFFTEARGVRYGISLAFRYPEGIYESARLDVHELRSGKLKWTYDIEPFPLIWPERTVSVEGGEVMDTATSSPRRPRTVVPSPANGRTQPVPVAPPKPADELPPFPDTTPLSTDGLVMLIERQNDPEIRWRIAEQNLELCDSARTYALIGACGDLIGERVAQWPVEKLRRVFAGQPGSIMTGLMHHWKVDKVLAIAEESVESERIIEWLRLREIERLMKMEVSHEVRRPGAARRVLNVDRDADPVYVRKAWRMLLGFVNADHGRAAERAIHRRKDEIVRHLNAAREVLATDEHR